MFKLHYNNSTDTVTEFLSTELLFGRCFNIPFGSNDQLKFQNTLIDWKNERNNLIQLWQKMKKLISEPIINNSKAEK